MFRVPADAIDMRVPREYVLPRGWQAFAIVALIPLWWLIGASFFMWRFRSRAELELLAGTLRARRGRRARPVIA